MKPQALVALVVAMALLSSPVMSADETEQEAKGQEYAGIFNAFADAAAPGVGTLVNTIWGIIKKPTKVKKQNELRQELEKKMQTELNTARTAAATEIKRLEPVAIQLETVKVFLDPVFFAEGRMSKLQSLIRSKSELSATDWADISEQWGEAKQALNEIPVSVEKVDAQVVDDGLAEILMGVLRARNRISGSVDKAITAKNGDRVVEKVGEIREAHSALYTASRRQISRLAREFRGLTERFKEPAGEAVARPPDTKVEEETVEAAKMLENLGKET